MYIYIYICMYISVVYFLTPSPNSCNNQGWARPMPRAWNFHKWQEPKNSTHHPLPLQWSLLKTEKGKKMSFLLMSRDKRNSMWYCYRFIYSLASRKGNFQSKWYNVLINFIGHTWKLAKCQNHNLRPSLKLTDMFQYLQHGSIFTSICPQIHKY